MSEPPRSRRCATTTRRKFLQQSALGATGVAAGLPILLGGTTARAGTFTARVAITKGDGRADNAFRAMQFFKREIAAAIGNKRIIVKPNVVNPAIPLADTHVDWLDGILEFLKSIGKTDILIAETSPHGTLMGFESMGYLRLLDRYPVRLVELSQEGSDVVNVWQNDSTLWPVQVSRLLRNPNNFVISCPRIKTHNNAVATIGVKNVVMGSAAVDPGFIYNQKSSTKFNKTPGMHGNPNTNQCLNDNIYRLIKFYGVHPHLSVIDGYQGMQGEGPSSGYAVDPPQKLGIASLDWVAADRVCVTLMGHDGYLLGTTGQPYPAYLNYCGQAGLGEWELSKIQVLGEPIAGNVVNYVPNSGVTDGSQLGMRATPKE